MTTFADELARHRATLTDGDFIPRLEAAKFIDYMEADHPEALAEWLRANAEVFVADALNNILRRERQSILRNATKRAFALAAKEAEQGNVDGLWVFDLVYPVDARNTRRKVGDMTGFDHAFVSRSYEQQGKAALMRAEFHAIVARKVGEKRTADVIPEEIYLQMYASIMGGQTQAQHDVA